VIVIFALVLPDELLAVTVYVPVPGAFGVPLMTPALIEPAEGP
jgi:hypothetical protein